MLQISGYWPLMLFAAWAVFVLWSTLSETGRRRYIRGTFGEVDAACGVIAVDMWWNARRTVRLYRCHRRGNRAFVLAITSWSVGLGLGAQTRFVLLEGDVLRNLRAALAEPRDSG